MRGIARCLGVFIVFWSVIAFSGCASVKSYDDLSAVQMSAIQESNDRLDAYDKSLQELDAKLAERKIRPAQYKRKADELTSLIAEESQFQNAILIKDPKIKVMARNLLDNIQKAVEASPVVIEAVGLEALRALAGTHGSITP